MLCAKNYKGCKESSFLGSGDSFVQKIILKSVKRGDFESNIDSYNRKTSKNNVKHCAQYEKPVIIAPFWKSNGRHSAESIIKTSVFGR